MKKGKVFHGSMGSHKNIGILLIRPIIYTLTFHIVFVILYLYF